MPNEKDSTEKHLLNYADVFADVVNVLVFHGKEVIDPKDLVSTEARSVLTLHGKTREQERDVVKIWTKGNTKIALVGLENQTLQDKDMPLRVLAYEGAGKPSPEQEQRTQRRENISMSFLCPVLRYNTLGKANEFAGMYRRHSRRTQILCQ